MASPNLKVIALISGGKDSLFSILHCLAHGHEIVALANLYPPSPHVSMSEGHVGASEPELEDIDSYMYQTVGHNVIPLYSQALGLPLYRQPILGSAVNTNKIYDPPSQQAGVPLKTANAVQQIHAAEQAQQPEIDETESLIPLLHKILSHHPTVNAISTGAILSTYQRTRVESVAIRLNLIPLSYLWQYTSLPPYTQTSLLDDIDAVGQDSRIIKVASGGLDESFLWENVACQRTKRTLLSATARFGGEGAVLGEGGEFETITIDGPRPLWKGRIDVPQDGRVIVKGGGGSAALKITGAEIVDKGNEEESGCGVGQLRVPELLDPEFQEILSIVESHSDKAVEENLRHDCWSNPALMIPCLQKVTLGDICIISNITAPDPSSSAKQQITTILQTLSAILHALNRMPSNIVSTTILLRSMSSFACINKLYGSFFTTPNPPARVTVACGDALPEGVQVILSVEINPGQPEVRRGLHVQSRSYWAPANIGPYSQATAVPLAEGDDDREGKVPEVVFVAGQIPLVPASMELWDGLTHDGIVDLPDQTVSMQNVTVEIMNGTHAFGRQAALALQHLWRIGRAMDVNWWTGAIVYIIGSSSEGLRSRCRMATRIWKTIHELLYDAANTEQDPDETDVVDIWDLKHGVGSALPGLSKASEDSRRPLPDFSNVVNADSSDISLTPVPPFFAIEVAELPRGASLEWVSTGISYGSVRVHTFTTEKGIRVSSCAVRRTGMQYLWASIDSISQLASLRPAIDKCLEQKDKLANQEARHYTVYTSPKSGIPAEWLKENRAQVIPCRSVWDAFAKELVAGIVVRVHEAAASDSDDGRSSAPP